MGKIIWNYCLICWIGSAIYYGYKYFFPSTLEQLTEYMSCYYVAFEFGNEEAMDAIDKKATQFMIEKKIKLSPKGMLDLKFKAKDQLFGKNLLDVFNSSFCQNLHGQPELSPTGLIEKIVKDLD